MRRVISSTLGASAIEFALVLPILIVLLFGIIEMGVFLYDKQMLTNAAREGARAGIVASIPRVLPTGTNSIESVVQSYCADHMVTFGNKNTPVLDPSPPNGYAPDAAFGDPLVVRVTYQYSFLILPNFLPGFNRLTNMEATAVMRYE